MEKPKTPNTTKRTKQAHYNVTTSRPNKKTKQKRTENQQNLKTRNKQKKKVETRFVL